MRCWSLVLTLPLALAACNAPAAGGAGQPSVAAALASGKIAAAILQQPSLKRVARSFQDPAAGKEFKVSQYWDYEPGTPFEVEDARVTTAPLGAGGGQQISVKADVKLPTPKALKYQLLQAEEDGGEEEVGGDAAATAAPVMTTTMGPEAESGASGAEDDHAEGAHAHADAEAEGPAPAEDLAGAETDEEITPEADDVAWEDDYLADADEDGELDEGEAAPYQEAVDEGTEDKILMAPHPVTMEVEDRPQAGMAPDVVRLKDEKTNQVLEIRHDQSWDRFELSNEAGKLEVVFQPDGSYLIDGKLAGGVDEAVQRLVEHGVVKGANAHLFSLLAARLGRLPKPETRGAPSLDTATSYRLLALAGSDTRRAFLLVDSLIPQMNMAAHAKGAATSSGMVGTLR